MHVMRGKERTPTLVDKNATVSKQTKESSLSGDGEWHS